MQWLLTTSIFVAASPPGTRRGQDDPDLAVLEAPASPQVHRLDGRATMTDSKPQTRPGQKTQRLVAFVVILLVAGIFLVSISLVQSIPPSAGAGVARAAGVVVFLLFGAAGAVGAAAGFLFGLPRSRVVDMTTTGGQTGAASNPPPSTSYLTNSNLIKVSDWLTTIIIGLGLVNLRKVPAAVEQLGAALEAPLGGMPYSGTIGVCVLAGGFAAAFNLTFLWTSIRVRELLEDSERESQGGVVPKLEGTTMDVARRIVGNTALQMEAPEAIPGDQVIQSQSPAPGEIVAPGSKVKVT